MLNFKVLQMTLSLLGRWNRLARPVESTILTFWNHNDFLMNKSRYWFYFLEGWPNKNPFRPHCIALYKESDYFLAELEAKTCSIKRPCITDCIVDPPAPPPIKFSDLPPGLDWSACWNEWWPEQNCHRRHSHKFESGSKPDRVDS